MPCVQLSLLGGIPPSPTRGCLVPAFLCGREPQKQLASLEDCQRSSQGHLVMFRIGTSSDLALSTLSIAYVCAISLCPGGTIKLVVNTPSGLPHLVAALRLANPGLTMESILSGYSIGTRCSWTSLVDARVAGRALAERQDRPLLPCRTDVGIP